MKNPDHLEGKIPPNFAPQKYPGGEMSGEIDYTEGADVTSLHAAILREHPEPRHDEAPQEGITTFPIWLLLLCAAAVFWAGGYLFLFSGAFRGDIFNERRWEVAMLFPQAEAGPQEETAAADDPMVLGSRFYTQNCQSCHQSGGQGAPPQYPPLAGAEWVTGNEARLAAIVLQGLEGELHVSGVTYNNVMPAWGGVLTDRQIAYILTYIRNSWGNTASPISAEQVAAARQMFADRKKPWTEPELLQIPEDATLEGGAPAGGAAAAGGAGPALAAAAGR